MSELGGLGSDPADRLGANSKTLYSVCDGIDDANWRALFKPIEEKYRVWIAYGKRRLENKPDGKSAEVETLLFETSQLNEQQYDYFKATLYQRFGIASGDYEHAHDYDEWMRIAEPAYEACRALSRQRRNRLYRARVYGHADRAQSGNGERTRRPRGVLRP